VPVAVGSRQIDERFHVFTWIGAAVTVTRSAAHARSAAGPPGRA
jgi:hypothetical protein